MVQRNKNKNALIGGLLAIVFVMAVGYAAFATQLNISGTANITSTWDVHIKSIAVKDGSKVGTAESVSATVDPDDNLKATFSTNLVSPGDSITYTVTIENSGNIVAELSKIDFAWKNKANTAGDTNSPIVYTHNGTTGTTVAADGGTATIDVTVTYNSAVTEQPAEDDLQSTLTMDLHYVQEGTTAETPDTPTEP